MNKGAAAPRRAAPSWALHAAAPQDANRGRQLPPPAAEFGEMTGRDLHRALGRDVTLDSIQQAIVTQRGTYMPAKLQGQLGYLSSMVGRGDQPPGTSWQPSPAEVQAAVRAANTARVDAADAGPDQRRDEPLPGARLGGLGRTA